jgi:steroid delta-isomerase-like uncharacterized protein
MHNTQIVRTFVEQFQSHHNWETFDAIIDPDIVDHSAEPGTPPGREPVRVFFEGMFAAFPDLHAEIHDQLEDGDKVVTRKTLAGTHQGEFMGIPATGAEARFDVIDIVRVRDGRIVEHWGIVDRLALLTAVGAVPAPA